MSKPTFTPGQWTAREMYECDEDEPSHWTVDGTFTVHGDDEDHLNEPDAHLIAAAPDLYAALEKALGGCDGDLCMHLWHDDARAALAKARGET